MTLHHKWSRNQLVTIRPDHPVYPGRTGYFQFLAGPEKDTLVMTIRPREESDCSGTNSWFSVHIGDVVK